MLSRMNYIMMGVGLLFIQNRNFLQFKKNIIDISIIVKVIRLCLICKPE